MIKNIGILGCGILFSFYFFPFEFTFLPGVNVKMMLAVLGLVMLGIRMAKGKNGKMDKDFLILSLWSFVVSLVSFFSLTWNGTFDFAYATHFISMWVWLSAAYCVCFLIRKLHGSISIILITKYLASVCLCQCLLAILIDNYPNIKQLVDTYVSQGQDYLNLTSVRRLYGIGASLDVAGSRFSAALVLLMFLLIRNSDKLKQIEYVLFVVIFILIAIIGNMVARTTTVGLVLSLLFLGYCLFSEKRVTIKWRKFVSLFMLILIVVIPLSIYLYNEDAFFHKQIRFAFEGLFSLVEKGEWDVSSNDELKDMIVFPSTFKTWLIGDGYFDNPAKTDPYFIGKIGGGFYMGTDIGYLRFIFYSGIVGLFAISIFIIKSSLICIRKFQESKLLFLMLLAVNFIVWLKVSTDIFLVFALFLMISKEENDAYDERLKLEA